MRNPSYQRKEPPPSPEELRRHIQAALVGLDPAQLAIMARLTPAERTQMAVSMIEAAEQAGVMQLRRREPELSEEEALRIVRRGFLSYLKEKQPSHGSPSRFPHLPG